MKPKWKLFHSSGNSILKKEFLFRNKAFERKRISHCKIVNKILIIELPIFFFTEDVLNVAWDVWPWGRVVGGLDLNAAEVALDSISSISSIFFYNIKF